MPGQRHIIKRQILEVAIRQERGAHQLQQQLSRIYRDRLVPMIDTYCSQLSAPDRIHRIDSLDVDLGTLDPENLEEDLVAKFTRQLPALLAGQIRHAEAMAASSDGATMQAISQLELLAYFARTGSVPWWADSARPGLLDEALQTLAQQAPHQLKQLMLELAREQRSLSRLIQHYDDRRLAELFLAVRPASQPDLAQLPVALLSLLPRLGVAAGRSHADIRTRVWHALLFTAALRSEQTKTPVAFGREVFLQIAGGWRVDYAGLLSAAGRAIDEQEARLDNRLGTIIQTLRREAVGQQLAGTDEVDQQLVDVVDVSESDVATPEPATKELITLLDRLQRARGPLAPVFAVLRPVVDRLPARSRADWLAALGQLERHTSDSETVDAETLQTIIGLLRPVLERRLLPSATIRRCLADLQEPGATDLPPEILSELSRMLGQSVEKDVRLPKGAPVHPRFSDADELYVGNAGLVILWPFLGRFFQHLELLEDKGFESDATVQRAVGLLGYLATEDPAPAEYLLPLCKCLCGMPVTQVFDFGPPVSEQEAEHCANLLQAAIVQAPILGKMSLAGFRGSFLIRQGVLSTRDGGWLLRVERETYDVVLDRFPWGFEWVKLPWMETPLRVEW